MLNTLHSQLNATLRINVHDMYFDGLAFAQIVSLQLWLDGYFSV